MRALARLGLVHSVGFSSVCSWPHRKGGRLHQGNRKLEDSAMNILTKEWLIQERKRKQAGDGRMHMLSKEGRQADER